ncbi:phosphatase PAP2 family protein [Schlesneria paludicola]|uniref:phosphatase PAP2 family protein n=1 Tax=Schlesneria paludicola TaxID=360056 RepID=UPI00029A3771|nr:phosphatase PAP2 family protein [Schlesneria paludicola]
MDAVIGGESLNHGERSRLKPGWLVPGLLLVASACSLLIDVPLATVFAAKQLPEGIDRPLREMLEICEAFGHGFGASLILITVVVLDPRQKRCLGWMIAGSLGAGLMANCVKLLVRRTRPRDFNWSATSVWDTFVRDYNESGAMQSFPSSHTALAVGLAVVLTSAYPRGRWLFVAMAILVGMQRIVSSAHFPSDVFAGAAVGWIVGKASVSMMRPRSE